jgi:cell wall-associated NlpC family hydrolase
VATPRLGSRHARTSLAHAPSTPSRRVLRSGLLLGASAALTLTLLPGTAGAAPGATSPTPDQLTQMVGAASQQLELVSEQVNTAQEHYRQEQAARAGADQALADAQARLTALAPQIREVARSAYAGGNNHLVSLDVLLTSRSANDFVTQLTTLNVIAGHTNTVVQQAAAAAQDAKKSQAQADQAETAAKKDLDDVTSKQADLQTKIADYQKQYDALTAPQQQQVQTARSGQAVAAPGPVTASSGAAQTAVNTALAQVGKPYVYGGAGPNSFDCSGLTQYSWAAAGVSLPHSAEMQAGMGSPVTLSALQPGDLVFYYSPIGHVAMYIGNGNIVHASTEGQPVKVVPLASMPGAVAARHYG